jgi:hypothetical protein
MQLVAQLLSAHLAYTAVHAIRLVITELKHCTQGCIGCEEAVRECKIETN